MDTATRAKAASDKIGGTAALLQLASLA